MRSYQAVEAEVRRVAAAGHALIERACEEALQGGRHGVLVLRSGGRVMNATVDESVPYGQIHERPA